MLEHLNQNSELALGNDSKLGRPSSPQLRVVSSRCQNYVRVWGHKLISYCGKVTQTWEAPSSAPSSFSPLSHGALPHRAYLARLDASFEVGHEAMAATTKHEILAGRR